MGDFNTPSEFQLFQKKIGGSNLCSSKTAVCPHSLTAKQRFSEKELFFYELNIDIAVIARYIQCLFSVVFIAR